METRKDELKTKITEGRAKLLATMNRMSEGDWDQATSNPEWTARDLLAHVANAEPGLLVRMQKFLDGTSQLPPGFDLNIWNKRQVSKRRGESIEVLVRSLQQSREQVLSFLAGLTDEQLDIRGWHASGQEMSLIDMFEILAWHERSHADDIATAQKR